MSESPAGARLNFAMRGDVRASPIEFSWGSQTVTSVTGALPLRGHLAGVAEHGGSVRFDLLLEAQAGRHLDRDRHFAHLKRIARQVKAVDDAGARAQAGESLQLLAPSARLRAQGIS
jgi:hypothetical protein